MKPPDHPVPSGDRTMARLLVRALEAAGHEVRLACRLRTRDPVGDAARQARFAALAPRLAAGYARRCARSGWRPDVWVTYHTYYKAPDWLGPHAAALLGIPYLPVEASVAPKRAGGAWGASHRALLAGLDRAAAIVPLNPKNAGCLPHPDRHREVLPFLDLPPAPQRPDRDGPPRLVAVGMFRPGAKLGSYRVLAEALADLRDRTWTLEIVGYGPEEAAVRGLFAPFAERVRWHGPIAPEALMALLGTCDLFVWPAVEEAYGMAILEAMAAGLPVVAGDEGGVSALVADGATGRLAPARDPAAFAACVAALLDDPAALRRMGAAGRAKAEAAHSLQAASRRLDAILHEIAGTRVGA
jgi:glycosyltransferase involved in cell wall biosynthesis